jgi:predicted RNase H-like HicB family nuclease
MLSAYPAIFYRDQGGQYSVIFPDLNHLATYGNDLEDAFKMAVDCLAGYLYEAKLAGEALPVASVLKSIDPAKEYDAYEEAFVNMVTVDVESYAKEHFTKAVKKTLSVPKWLNDAALAQNINFSQVLQEALKEKLKLGV